MDVVPKIVIGGQSGPNGSGGGQSGNVMEALLAMLLSDKIGADLGAAGAALPRNPQAERLRADLGRGLTDALSARHDA